MKGAIFENFVFSEIYKAFAHRGELPPLYFWRDRTGHEVDIVIDTGKRLVPVEIKSAETIDSSFSTGLGIIFPLVSLYRRQACLYTEGTHYIRGKTLLYAHGSNAPEINPVKVKFDEYYLMHRSFLLI